MSIMLGQNNVSRSRRGLTAKDARNLKLYGLNIVVAKQTRRLLNQMRKLKQRLDRKRNRALARIQNWNNRMHVRRLRAEKRKVAKRVRTIDEYGTEKIPKPSWTYNGAVGSAPTQRYVTLGRRQAFVDYHPIAKLDPPRNTTYGQRVKAYTLQCGFVVKDSKILATMPKSRWPALGLAGAPISDTLPQYLPFSTSLADKALQKAYAKVYEADIQTNEYLFEWKQVLNLMKDPMRTLVRSARLLDRWVGKDSWMLIPQRVVHKNKRLWSKDDPSWNDIPTGNILMSMRTRRKVSLSSVADSIAQEAANRWLQYRYGICPLVSDITKVMGMWVTPRINFPVRSVTARHWVSKTESPLSYTLRWDPLNFTFQGKVKQGQFYSSKVWYKLLEEPPMSYRLGVHPSQWLNVIWNGIPWSFVADWVINIDDWLKARTQVPWIQVIGSATTAKDYTEARVVCTKVTDTFTNLAQGTLTGYPLATKSVVRMNRKLDLPLPTTPLVSSAWNSIENAVTGLALIYQPLISKR